MTESNATLIERASRAVQRIQEEIGKAVVGQQDAVEHVLIALLAGGHVLIEGVPGLGKTLLVRALAKTFGGSFSRIQFTPDLMPSDVSGHALYDLKSQEFSVRRGPVFSNLVLADEINRAPAKTQAALLEAMQERACTVRGNNYKLPAPFFVLATQNPIELEGTYPLPEAQLDRFLFNIILDYLSADEELKVVDLTTTTHIPHADPITTAQEILDFQQLVRASRVKDPSAPDVVRKYVNYGASVRAAQFLVLGAKARALMKGRYHVSFEDVRALYVPILRHRVLLNFHAESEKVTTDDVLNQILQAKPAPRD